MLALDLACNFSVTPLFLMKYLECPWPRMPQGTTQFVGNIYFIEITYPANFVIWLFYFNIYFWRSFCIYDVTT
jgi:hypothetical protein